MQAANENRSQLSKIFLKSAPKEVKNTNCFTISKFSNKTIFEEINRFLI